MTVARYSEAVFAVPCPLVPMQPTLAFPDYIFFQGPDNVLWRVDTDGKGLTTPNCDNQTNSTPFVEGDRVFFQGVNNKLVMAWAYE